MKIHHVGFLSKNLEKSEAEFSALGFECEKQAEFDAIRKVNISFWLNGAYRVELIEPAGKDSPLYPLLKHYKNTPYHFCYESENFDADAKMLSDSGYFLMQDAQIAPCMESKRVCFFMGAGCGILELVEKNKNERNDILRDSLSIFNGGGYRIKAIFLRYRYQRNDEAFSFYNRRYKSNAHVA